MKTFTTLTTALLLASSAIASPLDTRSEKIEITTWSGDNCEGSSAHPSISGGTGCFESLPGASFNIDTTSSKCKVTTWSGDNCEGSSIVYAGTDTGCLGVAFGSVELKC